MCKASLTAQRTVDAVEGAMYGVGTSAHGFGALHPTKETADQCVACVKEGTMLTLTPIPADLQQKFGIGASAIVQFRETGHNVQDEVRLSNGKIVELREFSRPGLVAYVGVMQDPAPVDDGAGLGAPARELVDAGHDR